MDGVCPWYVLRAKTSQEFKALEELKRRRIESYVPQYSELRHLGRSRPVVVARPLFPGYVLSRFDFERRVEALQSPGIIAIVSFANHPATLDDAEVENIRRMVDSGLAKPVNHPSRLAKGQRGQITSGPLTGVRGEITRIRHKYRIVVRLEGMGSASAEIDPATFLPDQKK